MSLTTVSTKRNRVYQRKFDHDLARRLHQEGASYCALAERFGVSVTSVMRVCDPKTRERLDEATKKFMRANYRVPCLGECDRLVWMHPNTERSGYCQECWRAQRNAARTDVREGELRCFGCGEWKPDSDYGTYRPVKARRGHASRCRACETNARRLHRQKNPEMQRRADRRHYVKKVRTKVQTYVVLKPNGDNAYHEIARLDAVGATHAIEQAATGAGNYVAVPASRFTPMRVEPIQTFKVMPEPATSDGQGTMTA